VIVGVAPACPAAAQTPREVGGTRASPAPAAASADDGGCDCDLATEYEFALGAQSLSEDDLDATYGLLPSLGAGVSWRLLGHTRLVLAARYAVSRGDPYYDTPDFRDGEAARLRAVPVTLGLRGNLNPGHRLRFHLGCALQVAWLEEELPVAGGTGRFTGYGIGPLVTAGPEWRACDERRAVGLELAYGGRGGGVDRGAATHDVDLTGFHARIYYAFRPGAGTEAGRGAR